MKYNYLFLTFALLFSTLTFSQTGSIQGTVIDNDGLKLPYSNLLIESLDKGTISDADGKFRFIDVPAGTYTIKAMYLGFADKSVEVTVEDGQTTTLTITIEPLAEELDAVTVTGYASGQAKALNSQKNRQNITNVVSTDQIGKFPDANIGMLLNEFQVSQCRLTKVKPEILS